MSDVVYWCSRTISVKCWLGVSFLVLSDGACIEGWGWLGLLLLKGRMGQGRRGGDYWSSLSSSISRLKPGVCLSWSQSDCWFRHNISLPT